MNWVDRDGTKLVGISELPQVCAAFNDFGQDLGVSGPEYYEFTTSRGDSVISNIPNHFYERKDITKYCGSIKSTNNHKSLIVCLKQNVDLFQNAPGPKTVDSPDGKAFQLNRCYMNGRGAFILFTHLRNQGHIKLKNPIKVAFGYVENKLPFGTKIGNKVIESNNIIIHDWHVWNLVEGFLVDLTIFRNGGLLPPHDTINGWGTAADHIFKTKPKNLNYYGIEFEDLDEFAEELNKVIPFQ